MLYEAGPCPFVVRHPLAPFRKKWLIDHVVSISLRSVEVGNLLYGSHRSPIDVVFWCLQEDFDWFELEIIKLKLSPRLMLMLITWNAWFGVPG